MTTNTRPVRPLADRVRALDTLLGYLTPVPQEWLEQPNTRPTAGMVLKECPDYLTLIRAWKKALKWTTGLDHALTVMLASVASTKAMGDQLWVKIIGPAACGKSTLCEALAVNRDYVIAKSTIRGFHSGYRLDDGKGNGADVSLVNQAKGKTLVTKDGDTLLQSPNLAQILSEARDLYDSVSRTHYRNAISRDYEGVRMTWILAGTSSLRSIDSSELGERFLDCVIMESIDADLEEEILWRVANRTNRNLALESNGKPETQYEPELAEAMALTGGYVDYLRKNAQVGLGKVKAAESALRQIMCMGLFVAYLRARPSVHQEETAEREFGTRLVSQLTRLAKCLAFVLNRSTIDGGILYRVRRVALDTARGRTLDIVTALYKEHPEGLQSKTISVLTNQGITECRKFLRFLKKIEVVEAYRTEENGIIGGEKWKLTERFRRLYEMVMNSAAEVSN